jgi:CRP-like cAMP-binding protein
MASEAEGPVELHLPIDKALIAARLGMQPETFSRALARLRSEGVESVGDRVRVGDIARLRELAGGA